MSEILEELDEQIKGNPRGVLFYLKITLRFFVVVFLVSMLEIYFLERVL